MTSNIQTQLSSKAEKTKGYFISNRNFPNGIYITTDIDGSKEIAFLLKIEGNTYGGGLPRFLMAQGYIYEYNGAHYLNKSSFCAGYLSSPYIQVFINSNGYLSFWLNPEVYWTGYNVYCYDTSSNTLTYTNWSNSTSNRVTNVVNSACPSNITKVDTIFVNSVLDNSSAHVGDSFPTNPMYLHMFFKKA